MLVTYGFVHAIKKRFKASVHRHNGCLYFEWGELCKIVVARMLVNTISRWRHNPWLHQVNPNRQWYMIYSLPVNYSLHNLIHKEVRMLWYVKMVFEYGPFIWGQIFHICVAYMSWPSKNFKVQRGFIMYALYTRTLQVLTKSWSHIFYIHGFDIYILIL